MRSPDHFDASPLLYLGFVSVGGYGFTEKQMNGDSAVVLNCGTNFPFSTVTYPEHPSTPTGSGPWCAAVVFPDQSMVGRMPFAVHR